MSAIDKAYQTQLQNIQQKTGKNLAELEAFIRNSELTKHGEIRDMLKRELGLGHGVEVGINHKTLGVHPRLMEQPAGSMCNYKVKVTQADEVNDELISWVKQAYEIAG